jgi:hypothetical protein
LQALETRSKVYRLASLDPAQFISSLISLDALEPTTKLIADDKNKAIIAYASLSDHYTISNMLKRLDGSARDVEVIQLRRLRAEDVAGTIKFLMGTDDKKDDKSSRRNMFYYDPWGQNDKKETSKDEFRVAANSQDNQVLVWANEIERAEVMKLLIKLGELPPEGGSSSRVRVIDANRSPETRAYLKRLQEAWSKISPTPLELPSDDQFETDSKRSPSVDSPDESEEELDANAQKQTEQPGKKKGSKETVGAVEAPSKRQQNLARLGIPPGRLSNTVLQQDQSENEELENDKTEYDELATSDEVVGRSSEEPRAATPKLPITKPNPNSNAIARPDTGGIKISFDERGNLVLIGDDPEMLTKLEKIMMDNAPPQRGYEVFVIKHSPPYWIRLSLEDYFKEDKKEDKGNDRFFRWFFDEEPEKKKDDAQLGKKRKMRFISDVDTKTLIVIGADDAQLKTIEGLIKLWDVPVKTKKDQLRFSKLVQIEYSKAEIVADAIKEAYRDLLSTNDKAFEKESAGGGGGSGDSKEKTKGSSSDAIFEGGMNFSFKGRLSLGVDKVTNSIIVTAQGDDLLTLVCEMIEKLDQAARPSGTVEILKLDGANSKAMEKALMAWTKANNAQPNDPNANQQQQQQLQQQQLIQQQQQQQNQNSKDTSQGNR